jgi:hypothetical protein
MAKPLTEFLNNKESMGRVLAQVEASVGGRGLLGLISTRGQRRQALDSWEGFIFGERPQTEEINHYQTPSDWILEGRAILTDGVKRRWK